MKDGVVSLDRDNFEAFKQFCQTYKTVHDESFLYEEDFRDFEIGDANPTCLLYDRNQLVGICSLMQDDYHLRSERARVRQFYCTSERREDYERLLAKVFPLNPRVRKVNMFVPTAKKSSRDILDAMGFEVERFSSVMERCGQAPLPFRFPDGYDLTDYRPGIDEEDYLTVRNIAFSTLQGSETPHVKEQVVKYMTPDQILAGGVKILRHHGAPVGIIRMTRENDAGRDYSFVAPLAILPEHQGKGLGSMLLRAGIQAGVENGLPDCMLSVNVENENALKLYRREGFAATLELVCYRLGV